MKSICDGNEKKWPAPGSNTQGSGATDLDQKSSTHKFTCTEKSYETYASLPLNLSLPNKRRKEMPSKNLVQALLEVDNLESTVRLDGLALDEVKDTWKKLAQIGDEIVQKLVEWTRQLPFYDELATDTFTRLLEQNWSQLVLISVSYYICNHLDNSEQQQRGNRPRWSFADWRHNLCLLTRRISDIMGRTLSAQLHFTELVANFQKLKLSAEAYVCLKAVVLLQGYSSTLRLPYSPCLGTGPSDLKTGLIQDKVVKILHIHLSQLDSEANLSQVFTWLASLQTVSSVLLQCKMLYVPFLLGKYIFDLANSCFSGQFADIQISSKYLFVMLS
ncbi:unnamed protein product [Soboliphyme baturini]|uniref:NR LBD domain-containing protein n=1 Tax=Soboliphyme baturini TaxID=241478 RepID=A0A183IDL6_9BILA|nr:unnamed protein product [Soboliphyme baturini]